MNTHVDLLAEKVTAIGVLNPGDRLIVLVRHDTSNEQAGRLIEELRANLGDDFPFVVMRVDGVVIDRTGTS